MFAAGFDGESVARVRTTLRCESVTPAVFKQFRHIFDLGREFRRLLLPEERVVRK
jgi:hypothetical protein